MCGSGCPERRIPLLPAAWQRTAINWSSTMAAPICSESIQYRCICLNCHCVQVCYPRCLARYASYQALAEIIRQRFVEPQATLHELFGRLVFNILCGNTDDHTRNHAAFWDGSMLTLTPAYDICPQGRTGREASQAMRIDGEDNLSRLSTCLRAAPHFQLSRRQALELIEAQLRCIAEHWQQVAAQAQISPVDRNLFWGRQFLNPYAFVDLEGEADGLRILADELRGRLVQ